MKDRKIKITGNIMLSQWSQVGVLAKRKIGKGSFTRTDDILSEITSFYIKEHEKSRT